MNFFRVKSFRKAKKPNPESEMEDPVPPPENGNGDDMGKPAEADPMAENEDDDDDFIMSEVKRRLKELRRNSFMVLIPEEECPEEEADEEDAETSSSDWRDADVEGRNQWCVFDDLYDKYCDKMLFFDRMIAQHLNEAGTRVPATPSRSASKKLTSPLSCLSLKKIEEPEEETVNLQQAGYDPNHDLEIAYVAQICLSWEALHCQYTQLSQKIACQPENSSCYNDSAQQFQQFQVLLQRFIENEPFEEGLRAETYTRTRNKFSKLLQVPKIQGSEPKEKEDDEELGFTVATDLIKIIENSILTFHLFLKTDKKKSKGVLNLFGGQNQTASPLQQIQSSLEKKEMKMKEARKKKKGWKKKSWPVTQPEVELLFGLIDIKILLRLLRMSRISKDQLLWCEEKMNKLVLSAGKLQRDPSLILFPC